MKMMFMLWQEMFKFTLWFFFFLFFKSFPLYSYFSPRHTHKPTNQQDESSSTTNDPERDWFGCLIMLPVRLGLEKIHNDYKCSIQNFFEFPQCVGIVGGRKNQSVWFVACQVIFFSFFFIDAFFNGREKERGIRLPV